MGYRPRYLPVLAGAAVLAAGIGLAVVPAAGAATTTVTASTQITGRDDSGFAAQPNNANNFWATDSMTRTVTVTLVGLHSGPECGTLTTCYEYTGSVVDTNGTFVTDTGAVSPNAGVALVNPPVKGTFTGGASDFTFYADSNAPSADGVPATATGDGPTDTSDWIKLLFPQNTSFNGSLLPDWAWTYKDAGCETWTDAYNVTQANSGDITGADKCSDTVTVTSPGSQTWTSGSAITPIQVQASSSDPNASISSYAATGLPAGVSIDASTGKISGTPNVVSSYTATVTATDSRGASGQATFAWTVKGQTVVAPIPTVGPGEVSSFTDYSASCLDNSNFTWVAGNKLQLWKCGAASGVDQQFELTGFNGKQVLEAVAPANKPQGPWCVTTDGMIRDQLTIESCTGAKGQEVAKQGSNYVFVATGLVMDDAAFNVANGAKVIGYTQNGGRNQHWSLP